LDEIPKNKRCSPDVPLLGRRQDLVLRIAELIDKRNNIAHGDFATEATAREVKLYSLAVANFCQRADRRMSIQVSRLFKVGRPW